MDITVILPIHKIEAQYVELLKNALNSFIENTKSYAHGTLKLLVITTQDALSSVTSIVANSMGDYSNYAIVINQNETDFCTQINEAVSKVDTEYFSILEMDDEYSPKWFNMMYPWYEANTSVSVFLPINVQYNEEHTQWQYGNELVWASSFSNELGVIDFDCLSNCSTFNLTGGVFNTEDYVKIGGLKSSIKVAFNYEFLLRLTDNKLQAIVVPKEGYKHLIGRSGSLTSEYESTITDEEIAKWFELAKSEYPYKEDRKKTIVTNVAKETLK